MKLSVGADGRMPVVDATLKYLEEQGHEVTFYGPASMEDGFNPYPDVARRVAEDVASGEAEDGIVFCYTGTGVTIAANKVPGIRAALVADSYTAKGARWWNNANVLAMSMRKTTDIMAREIIDAWFENQYDPDAEESITSAVDTLMGMDTEPAKD